jgi:hypothetical protein
MSAASDACLPGFPRKIAKRIAKKPSDSSQKVAFLTLDSGLLTVIWSSVQLTPHVGQRDWDVALNTQFYVNRKLP